MSEPNHPEIPPESRLLKDVYRVSGLTVNQLAVATGMSASTIHIALAGFRYRDSEPRLAVPPDHTLVKLSTALGIAPSTLSGVGRHRAAELLLEATKGGEASARAVTPTEREAQASAAARAALVRDVLAAFTTTELEAELERRDETEERHQEAEDLSDIAQTLRADQY